MSTLAEIQAAAELLPLEQQEKLFHALDARLHSSSDREHKAHVLRRGGDTLLEASPDAPAMTPEAVRRLLADFP